jgi:hypothetical protein
LSSAKLGVDAAQEKAYKQFHRRFPMYHSGNCFDLLFLPLKEGHLPGPAISHVTVYPQQTDYIGVEPVATITLRCFSFHEIDMAITDLQKQLEKVREKAQREYSKQG